MKTSLAIVASCLVLSACSAQPTDEPIRAARSRAALGDIVVDMSSPAQHIEGFGASSAWTGTSFSSAILDELFSAEHGIGLSLLRVRIAPDGSTGETATALGAQARGARVWAAPWSPPGAWKTSGTDNYGGALLPERYDDWANRLAGFVGLQQRLGVNLIGLSAQNEPNWKADWETCEWTPTELATFIGQHLAPALASRGLSTPIIAPETINWNTVTQYSDALLADDAARNAVSIIATHSYDGVPFYYAKAHDNQKSFWETELSDSGDRDDGMGSGLRIARVIHDHLTIARVNAWHFWWILPNNGTSEHNDSLINGGVITRRAYVIGNYSKFVRPGAVRVAASSAVALPGIHVTAFRHDELNRTVVVAINANESPISQRFVVPGLEASVVTPWETSEAAALEARSDVAVNDEAFEYSLPALSVTTFVAHSQPLGSGGSGGAAGSAGSAGGTSGNAGETSVAGRGGAAGAGASSGHAGRASAGGSSWPYDARATGPVNFCGCGFSPESNVARHGWKLAGLALLGAWARRRRRLR